MRVERQLSIFLDNRPGSLAAVCQDLERHDVNIEAITVANLVDHAVVRMVVSDPRAAQHVLAAAGTLVIASDVLAIELPDAPGAIAALAHTLGRARVNIDYMYGSSRRTSADRAVVFLRVSDLPRAKQALANGGEALGGGDGPSRRRRGPVRSERPRALRGHGGRPRTKPRPRTGGRGVRGRPTHRSR